MFWLRGLVFGVPVAIAMLFAAAFVNTAFIATQKRNEMTLGGIGEPTKLNPIQAADGAASEITSLVFSGLIKYDENLEIVGELAKAWEQSQTTTLAFTSPEEASNALAALIAMREGWSGWNLTNARVEGLFLMLEFSLPGLDASRQIVNSLADFPTQPFVSIRVSLASDANETWESFREKAGIEPVRTWFPSDGMFEITVTGDAETLVQKLTDFFAERPELKATVAVADTLPFLAEPEITFALREDVFWHDGAPFTARDVLFTYRAIMDDAVVSPRRPDYESIQSVEAIGDFTVRVVYRRPYSPALSSWGIGMLPVHLLEGVPPAEWATGFNRAPVGTGPFRFGEWKTNQYVRLFRNSQYFEGSPTLESIVFRVLPDPVTLRLAFETKQVDFWGVDPWAVGSFLEDPRFEVFRYPSRSYSYVGWNLREPVFQDLRVRTAFAHAVNIPQMIKYILYGNGEPSTGPFTPQIWFYNAHVEPLKYDPDEARRLLDEAGWKVGPDGIRSKDGKRLAFTLITNNATEVRRDIATLVQDNLRSVGAEVRVELYEWAVFITKFIDKRQFEATVLGWSTGLSWDAYQIWHSSQTGDDMLNFVSYKNPKVDWLLTQLRQEYDRERIIRLAGELQAAIYHDQPYLFLFVPTSTAVMWKDSYRIYRPTAKGFEESPVELTKAGWNYYLPWFYRPDYPPARAEKASAP